MAINGNEVAIAGKAGPLVFQGGQDTLPDFNFSNPHGNAFIARFDRQSGQPLGLHPVDGPNNHVSTGYSLAAGPNGDYYLGGNFRSSLHVGADTLYQVGSASARAATAAEAPACPYRDCPPASTSCAWKVLKAASER